MIEKIISTENYTHTALWGVNEKTFEFIKILFPKVKLILRGDELKVLGDEEEILNFTDRFEQMLSFFDKFGKLREEDILGIVENKQDVSASDSGNDILVHGRNGMLIKARTPNQHKLVESCHDNDLVFAIGPAGSGKTYTAVALAVRALRNREVKRIILTRPAVEAGENLGFLPGDLRDKLDPYLQPLYDALRDMIPAQKLLSYWEENIIEIAPLAFMRGRTLDNAFVILDEAQNATQMQLKMFLTRMGKNAKFVVTGDITQIDLPKNQHSGLVHATKILENVEGIGFIYLNESDIVRHKLVKRIIRAYDKEV